MRENSRGLRGSGSLGRGAPQLVTNRLQPVEVGADYVHVLVCHHSCKVLPHAAAHYARLAVIHFESFFKQDGRRMNRRSSPRIGSKSPPPEKARDRQHSAYRLRRPHAPAHSSGSQRDTRINSQAPVMWARPAARADAHMFAMSEIKKADLSFDVRIRDCALALKTARGVDRCTYPAQQIGDAFGVSRCAKERLHAS